jgi:hypothetical protein
VTIIEIAQITFLIALFCREFVTEFLNYPKADKKGFYVFYLILLKNEPQIGRRPMKGDFLFNFVEK